jgi:AAA ATPase domain
MSGRKRRADKAATVADSLDEARRRHFVGRKAEIEMFREAVEAPDPEFVLLFVYGPGGIGKTALLESFIDIAEEAGTHPVRLDLRAVDPSPPAFSAALARALGLDEGADPLAAINDGPRRTLLLDTYETVAGLDDWLRETFLPKLRLDMLVVVAGRQRPGEEWSTDPGWRELVRVSSLRNLAPPEARAYLEAAGVPGTLCERAMMLAHGHPLALSLLVDVLSQSDGTSEPLDLTDAPDVLPPLVQRFAEGAPSDRHREALQIAAQAQFTTEALLHLALQGEDVPELFAWLRGLSFVEECPLGVFPHDLARDVIDADLRWRDEDGYASLHRRVRAAMGERLSGSEGPALRQAVAETVFLHRANPLVSSYWDWETFGRVYADELHTGDRNALLEMVERHENADSAAVAEHWMDRQPEGFAVARMGGEQPVGFSAVIALHEASAEDLAADPGAHSMWKYAQRHGAPRSGEEVFAVRFLVDAVAYQSPSPTLNLLTVIHPHHVISRPLLTWDFIGALTDPDLMGPLLSYIDYHPAREADFEIGGLRYGVFAHDWRRVDASEWLELMAERELGQNFDPNTPLQTPPPMLVLSEAEFAESVRRALRDLQRPEALSSNPLMRSRAVRDYGGERPSPEALRDLLDDAINTLRVDSRDEKLHRALGRTYVRPARTQELAAEALGLPFSTYRRHLSRGVARVVEWLWQRELYGPEG